jgi:gamma-tubulin complex component 2
MLKDYQTLLSQLEHAFNTSPLFSLQKLWFYVHPTIHTLSLIYQLVLELGTAEDASDGSEASSSSSAIDEEEEARQEALGLGRATLKAVLSESNQLDSASIMVKGGEVLTIMYDKMQGMSGDPTARKVYGALLRAAGAPYVGTLKVWMAKGRLVDPYEELCVKESKFINKAILESDYTDEYWERRYTVRLTAFNRETCAYSVLWVKLRDGSTVSGMKQHQAGVPPPRTPGGRLPGGACVPPHLEGWKHKILLAGKYLNVIRECGIENHREDKEQPEEEMSMEDEKFVAYRFNTELRLTGMQILHIRRRCLHPC